MCICGIAMEARHRPHGSFPRALVFNPFGDLRSLWRKLEAAMSSLTSRRRNNDKLLRHNRLQETRLHLFWIPVFDVA
ncbi:hypothetical protein EYF80_057871 [Liparis tanakae]|uniref:Uncharacterized protein n=1 Tax=Liparis tanakae TaxID=230148 RepID=A0A4Z2ET35_9TELE|nr:hypothetical protein EYF80_057871 [Liparis tanakae]